jgi:hypothetical protein
VTRRSVSVTVSGITDDHLFARTLEAFGRAMAGIALEGVDPMMYVDHDDEDEETDL